MPNHVFTGVAVTLALIAMPVPAWAQATTPLRSAVEMYERIESRAGWGAAQSNRIEASQLGTEDKKTRMLVEECMQACRIPSIDRYTIVHPAACVEMRLSQPAPRGFCEPGSLANARISASSTNRFGEKFDQDSFCTWRTQEYVIAAACYPNIEAMPTPPRSRNEWLLELPNPTPAR